MGALADLWKSERGLIALVLIICVTVLASIGHVTFPDWQSYTTWVFGIYVAGKTATGVTEAITSPKSDKPTIIS